MYVLPYIHRYQEKILGVLEKMFQRMYAKHPHNAEFWSAHMRRICTTEKSSQMRKTFLTFYNQHLQLWSHMQILRIMRPKKIRLFEIERSTSALHNMDAYAKIMYAHVTVS